MLKHVVATKWLDAVSSIGYIYFFQNQSRGKTTYTQFCQKVSIIESRDQFHSPTNLDLTLFLVIS